LRQATRVASETDSESCGTLTSTCMEVPFPNASRLGPANQAASFRVAASHDSAASTSSFCCSACSCA
jgi:hypothetical protein